MKKSILIISLFVSASGISQLTTPGTGENYNLSELSALDPTVLGFDGTKYILNADLIIAASDTLEVTSSDTLFVDPDKRITIEGSLITDAGENNIKFFISSSDTLNPAEGIRFEEHSFASIKNTEFTYIGGLKVMTEEFLIENCFLAHNVSGVSTGAVISLSRGAAVIRNNVFFQNDLPAVGSGANQKVAAQIIGNRIEKNGQTNVNRPQLNMGPTGEDTLRVIDNMIIGDRALTMVGGVGVSNFMGATAKINAIIENNTIQDNRYGVTIAGSNANALIKGNTIEDNDTQNDPALGGSGISVNSTDDSQSLILRENKIRRNLWGITVISKGSVDLGTIGDLGDNVFSENGNNGEFFALYNNTSLPINAMGNCWIETNETADSAAIEEVITHQVDDPLLGVVDFSLPSCGTLGIVSFDEADFTLYPNPAENSIQFENKMNFEKIEFFTLNGQLINTFRLDSGHNQINVELPQGLYMLHFTNANHQLTKKLMIK